MTNRDSIKTPMTVLAACLTAVVLMTGCSSLKTPATADVAVSRAAVDNAASAGAAELAPDEMRSAREKMRMANQALKNWWPSRSRARAWSRPCTRTTW